MPIDKSVNIFWKTIVIHLFGYDSNAFAHFLTILTWLCSKMRICVLKGELVMTETQISTQEITKFCKHCGEKINVDSVICVKCGRQVENIGVPAQPSIVINNSNTNVNTNVNMNTNEGIVSGRLLNKWVALALCLFLGLFGAHKFYEGKTGMGVLYLLHWVCLASVWSSILLPFCLNQHTIMCNFHFIFSSYEPGNSKYSKGTVTYEYKGEKGGKAIIVFDVKSLGLPEVQSKSQDGLK